MITFLVTEGIHVSPLLISYPDPEPGPQQHFSMAHGRTRAWVEIKIGLLKAWF